MLVALAGAAHAALPGRTARSRSRAARTATTRSYRRLRRRGPPELTTNAATDGGPELVAGRNADRVRDESRRQLRGLQDERERLGPDAPHDQRGRRRPAQLVAHRRQIVFASDRDGNIEIYKMNADGTGQTRLTNNAVADEYPAWSPTNTKIAFHARRRTSRCSR